jgi:hypothetical protein
MSGNPRKIKYPATYRAPISAHFRNAGEKRAFVRQNNTKISRPAAEKPATEKIREELLRKKPSAAFLVRVMLL